MAGLRIEVLTWFGFGLQTKAGVWVRAERKNLGLVEFRCNNISNTVSCILCHLSPKRPEDTERELYVNYMVITCELHERHDLNSEGSGY
jgi:hypothetical protein